MNGGWIILDKPSGMTSRRAGGIVSRMFGIKKFGHLGTLDPMASGVLPIALGDATKIIPYLEMANSFQECAKSKVQSSNNAVGEADTSIELCTLDFAHCQKKYLFEITWGIRTDTDDITGKILEQNDNVPTTAQIESVLPELTGEIWQTPPAYSAVHIKGRRAYELARAGQVVEIPARKVMISDLRFGLRRPLGLISDFDDKKTNLIVSCSTGTYVRTITQDIAKKCSKFKAQSSIEHCTLNFEHFLATTSMIRRVATNGFDIKNAVSLDFLENMYNNDPNLVKDFLLPIDFGLDGIPVLKLNDAEAKLFSNGGFIPVAEKNGLRRVYDNNKLIGIGIIDGSMLKPDRILITDHCER